jgi:hypothetical protein
VRERVFYQGRAYGFGPLRLWPGCCLSRTGGRWARRSRGWLATGTTHKSWNEFIQKGLHPHIEERA